jgi:hypothetical protein
MNTDQLITAIAADAAPSRRLGRLLCYAAVAGVAGTGVLFFSAIGPRPDLAAALDTWRFVLKFVITAPLAIAATLIILAMARPDGRDGYRLLPLVAAPLGLLAVAASLELLALPRSLWMVRLVGSNSVNCMTLIPLLAIIPLAAFLAVLRHGAPRDPGSTGAVAGLAAAAIAASFYALNCFDDSPLFVITWYPLATSMVAACGYLLGRRILRW